RRQTKGLPPIGASRTLVRRIDRTRARRAAAPERADEPGSPPLARRSPLLGGRALLARSGRPLLGHALFDGLLLGDLFLRHFFPRRFLLGDRFLGDRLLGGLLLARRARRRMRDVRRLRDRREVLTVLAVVQDLDSSDRLPMPDDRDLLILVRLYVLLVEMRRFPPPPAIAPAAAALERQVEDQRLRPAHARVRLRQARFQVRLVNLDDPVDDHAQMVLVHVFPSRPFLGSRCTACHGVPLDVLRCATVGGGLLASRITAEDYHAFGPAFPRAWP